MILAKMFLSRRVVFQLHYSCSHPVILQKRLPMFAELAARSVNGFAGFSSASDGAAEEKSSGFFSWVGKIKGAFTGKTQQDSTATSQTSPVDQQEAFSAEFNLINFADHLMKVRRFGSLIKFGRGLPRDGEATVTRSLEKQENIVRALASHDPTGQHLDLKHKSEVATQCSCTIKDVDDVLAKYEWMRTAADRVHQLQKEGKPLPKTWNEIENMMGGPFKPDASRQLGKQQEISRNAPCTCGSGKRYKRCCGKSPS